jgi:hypothetical protein
MATELMFGGTNTSFGVKWVLEVGRIQNIFMPKNIYIPYSYTSKSRLLEEL